MSPAVGEPRSLTGAWSEGGEAGQLALEAATLQRQLDQDTRAYLRDGVPDLLRLLRVASNRKARSSVASMLFSIACARPWSEGLAREVGQAIRAISLLAHSADTPEPARAGLAAHAHRLDALRRRAADVIHLEVLARVSAARGWKRR